MGAEERKRQGNAWKGLGKQGEQETGVWGNMHGKSAWEKEERKQRMWETGGRVPGDWALEDCAVCVRGVEKEYRDFCLGPIDFYLPSGCITGLAGENGAGKTTLIRTILGLARPEQGTVSCFGQDIKAEGKRLREQIGAVLGEIGLPGMFTAQTAMRLWEKTYRSFDRRYFMELSERLQIPGNKQLHSLSSGTGIKLAIAGAMSHRPRLLLLDEPLNGLDPISREEVMDMIRDFARDEEHTVLISSHILSDLEKIADYIAVMQGGRLKLFEEKDALMERFAAASGSWEEISALARVFQMAGYRRNRFGAWALFDRESAPGGRELLKKAGGEAEGAILEPASLEEIVVCLMKEEKVGREVAEGESGLEGAESGEEMERPVRGEKGKETKKEMEVGTEKEKENGAEKETENGAEKRRGQK